MCWSFEVSLVFGTLEFLTISVLLRRNQHHDRCLATLLFPIMMQEFCQMMIWRYVGEDASTCPAENFFWGKAANLFYESVPLFANIAAWQWLWFKLPDKWTWDIHLLIASTVLAFVGYVLGVTNRFYVLPPVCTFPGPCGHLLFLPAGGRTRGPARWNLLHASCFCLKGNERMLLIVTIILLHSFIPPT